MNMILKLMILSHIYLLKKDVVQNQIEAHF